MEPTTAYNAAADLIDQHLGHGPNDDLAILEHGRPALTYSALHAQANAWAVHFQNLQVKPGQRVAMLLPDCQEFVAAFLGILKLGAVAVPINTFLKTNGLADILNDCLPVVLLTNNRYRESAISACPDCIKLVDSDDVTLSSDETGFENHPTAETDPAFWLYTSGSTGTPKAAIHRHESIRSCATAFGHDVLKLSNKDRCLSASKLFFAYGLGNSLLFPLLAGASVVLCQDRPNTETLSSLMREWNPTLFFAVPTLYRKLLEDEVAPDAFASVRLCVSAGEYLPPTLIAKWSENIGQPIYDGIGTTEALHIFCANRPGCFKAGTNGKPVNGYHLRIVDEAGAPVVSGEIGRLMVRGATISRGYWQREEADRDAFEDEWLITGDLFRQDDDGFFIYAGRKNDSFKSSGLWVSSTEIESVLMESEAVRETVVLALADQDGLLAPHAFIRLSDQADVSADDLGRWLRMKLPSHKRPRCLEILDDFPRTGTGKVCRQSLRASAMS